MPDFSAVLSESTSSTSIILLLVLMWAAWLLVLAVACSFAFMMLAFADSPGSPRAVRLLIVPMFVWVVLAVVLGATLLIYRGYWQVPLAFILATSPPFMMFLCFNLFSGPGRPTPVATPTSVQPSTTPGRFVPPPVVAPAMTFPKADWQSTNVDARFEPDPIVANRILDLAQDWGKDFLQPTQPRTAALFPHLSEAEIDEYDRLARDVMKIAQDALYRNPDAQEAVCSNAVRRKHSWVNDENLGRLFSQGKWFANK